MEGAQLYEDLKKFITEKMQDVSEKAFKDASRRKVTLKSGSNQIQLDHTLDILLSVEQAKANMAMERYSKAGEILDEAKVKLEKKERKKERKKYVYLAIYILQSNQ